MKLIYIHTYGSVVYPRNVRRHEILNERVLAVVGMKAS